MKITKKCEYPDCTEELNDWQKYCVKHYIEVESTGVPEQMRKPEPIPVPPEPKPVPPEPVQKPTRQPSPEEIKALQEQWQKEGEEQQRRMQIKEKAKQVPKKKTLPELPIFNKPKGITEKERLEIKQTAFNGAIKFLIELGEFSKDFQDLIEEVRTLTAHFYNVIVEYNEEKIKQKT